MNPTKEQDNTSDTGGMADKIPAACLNGSAYTELDKLFEVLQQIEICTSRIQDPDVRNRKRKAMADMIFEVAISELETKLKVIRTVQQNLFD